MVRASRAVFASLVPSLAVVAALPFALACIDSVPDPNLDAARPDAGVSDDAAASVDAPTPDAPRGPDAGPPDDLQGAVDYWTEVGGLAGVAALAADGDTRIVVTSGMATDTTPVDEHTLFNVASISKTFTGALVLSLAEDGVLDLDAPLAEIVPDVPIVHPEHPDVAITPRMLLSHTSGIVDDFLFLGEYTYESDPTVSLEQFARDYVVDPAHWGATPGTERSYCNACFGILGMIVERVSGQSVRDLSRARLFEPMALDGAGWFFADVDVSRVATPYARRGRGYSALVQRNYAFYTATSLMISVDGLERWLRMHLELGTLEGARVFEESSIAETRRAQFPSIDGGQYLVWYAQGLDGRTWIGHSGSSYGTSTQMRYQPEEGRILVVLTNSDAYIRNRVGNPEGADAIDAILSRLDHALD
ncbi:MAG: beta-lactamase family protein [Sandaracinaceae bacterium]|nr:beta-lactamase family protein [Sandaracinaceae bacterium]